METNNKKILIFSGGTDGIGRNSLNFLVKEDNLKFILPVRNIEKGEKVVEELKQINSNADIKLMRMDLSSFESIKDFVKEFNEMNEPLDILVNNAGVINTEFKSTSDGYESTMGVNHLGSSLLTFLLLPKLNRSQYGGNIVFVSSKMHDRINELDFDKVLGNENKSNFNGGTYEYCKSKLYNLLFAKELQNKLNDKGSAIKVNALHPGFAVTNLFDNHGWFANKIVLPILVYFKGNKLEEMGLGLADLTLNKSNEKGKYFTLTKVTEPSKFASNPINATKLWNKTCQLLSIDFDKINL
ncbi:hypothetical protein RB653_010507 [Dictyostelium firmibasis]|uniref:Uncharacterized protein n=1 Tax=Dictyostelium firmibasis TaxID=79012 RepID=A0AAN7TZF7_9MYCE